MNFLVNCLRLGGFIISFFFISAVVAAVGSVVYPDETQARAHIAWRNPGGVPVAKRITDIYRANYFDYGSANLGYWVTSVEVSSEDPREFETDFVYPCDAKVRSQGLYVTVTVQFYSLFFLPKGREVVSCAL